MKTLKKFPIDSVLVCNFTEICKIKTVNLLTLVKKNLQKV